MLYKDQILSDNPLGYWRLGEASGALIDSSGNDYNGSYYGAPTFGVPGLVEDVDTAVRFNGTSQYADVTSEAPFDLTSGFTLECWVNLDTVTAWQRFISKSPAGGWGFGTTNTGNLLFTTYGILDYATTATPLTVGTTHHLVVVFDSAYDAHFYVDGVFLETVAGAAPANLNNNKVYLGQQGNGTQYLDGVLDEVAVYNYELSAAQIAEHHTTGTTPPAYNYSGLIVDDGPYAYWRLDETAGTTAADEIGANDGTYINGVTLNQTPAVQDGTSIRLDGTDDRIDTPISSTWLNNNASLFTIELWAYATDNNYGAFWGWRKENNAGGAYFARLGTTQQLAFTLAAIADYTFTYVMPANVWKHLVIVRNGTSVKLYVDGTLEQTLAISGNHNATDNPLTFGTRRATEPASVFAGYMDEPAIYNKVLSDAEILRHYNVGAGNELYAPEPAGGIASSTVQVTDSVTASTSRSSSVVDDVSVSATASGAKGISSSVQEAVAVSCSTSGSKAVGQNLGGPQQLEANEDIQTSGITRFGGDGSTHYSCITQTNGFIGDIGGTQPGVKRYIGGLVDPYPPKSGPITVTWQAAKNNSSGQSVYVRLHLAQGGSVIKSSPSYLVTSTAYSTYTLEISEAEAAAITDYDNLRLWVDFDRSTALLDNRAARVRRAYVTVPAPNQDATSATANVEISTIAQGGPAQENSADIDEVVTVATSAEGVKGAIGDTVAEIVIQSSISGASAKAGNALASVEVSENAAGQIGSESAVSETINVSESAAVSPGYQGQLTDTIEVTESASGASTRSGSTQVAVSVDDSAVGAGFKSGVVTDEVSVAVSSVGAANYAGTTSETINVSESAAGQITRVYTDYTEWTEVLAQEELEGSISDIVQVADSAAGEATRSGETSQAINISVEGEGAKAVSDTISETVEVSESASYFIPIGGEGVTQTVVEVSTAIDWVTTRSGVTSTGIAAIDTVAISTSRSDEASVSVNVESTATGEKSGLGSDATPSVVSVSTAALGEAARQVSIQSLVDVATEVGWTRTASGVALAIVMVSGSAHGQGPFSALRIYTEGLEPPNAVAGKEPATAFSGRTASNTFSANEPSLSMMGIGTSTLVHGRRAISTVNGAEPATAISGNRKPTSFSGNEPNNTIAGREPPSSLNGREPATTFSGRRDSQ